MNFNYNNHKELTIGQFDYETENYVYEYNMYNIDSKIIFCLDRYIHDDAIDENLIVYNDELIFNESDFNGLDLQNILIAGKNLLDQRCYLYDHLFQNKIVKEEN